MFYRWNVSLVSKNIDEKIQTLWKQGVEEDKFLFNKTVANLLKNFQTKIFHTRQVAKNYLLSGPGPLSSL